MRNKGEVLQGIRVYEVVKVCRHLHCYAVTYAQNERFMPCNVKGNTCLCVAHAHENLSVRGHGVSMISCTGRAI